VVPRGSLDSENTTVIDLTYSCNASCNYCQWGNRSIPGRSHRSLDEILLPVDTLNALGTRRIVLSGGEPRLHPMITKVLQYYREIVDSVVIITNGYGLDTESARRLAAAGATGITVSLDSTDAEVAFMTRKTSPALHSQILKNLRQISLNIGDLELGINSVVSHPTAKWSNVESLLNLGFGLNAMFVKFQPLFDDGYVSKNAPHLKLSGIDTGSLLDIAERIDAAARLLTNPSQFWKDLAHLASGNVLQARWCGLGPRHSILTRDKLNVCYWLDSASFGESDFISKDHAIRVRQSFETEKLSCSVGYHCFCNQNISHQWKGLDRETNRS